MNEIEKDALREALEPLMDKLHAALGAWADEAEAACGLNIDLTVVVSDYDKVIVSTSNLPPTVMGNVLIDTGVRRLGLVPEGATYKGAAVVSGAEFEEALQRTSQGAKVVEA